MKKKARASRLKCTASEQKQSKARQRERVLQCETKHTTCMLHVSYRGGSQSLHKCIIKASTALNLNHFFFVCDARRR